jgi:protein MAK11
MPRPPSPSSSLSASDSESVSASLPSSSSPSLSSSSVSIPSSDYFHPLRVVLGTYHGVVYCLETVNISADLAESDSDVSSSSSSASFLTLFSTDSHRGSVKSLRALDSGAFLASAGVDETIRIYNTKVLRDHGSVHRHTGSIVHLTSFASSCLFSCSEDGSIGLIETGQWEMNKTLKGHKGSVYHLSVHPSGKLALSVGKDHSLRLWDLVHCSLATTRHFQQEIRIVEWNKNGQFYALTSDKIIWIYSLQGEVLYELTVESKILCLCWLSEGIAAIGMENGMIHLLEIDNGKFIYKEKIHESRVKAMDSLVIEYPEETSESEQEDNKQLFGLSFLVSISTDGVVLLHRLTESCELLLVARAASESRLTSVCFLPHYDPTKEPKKGNEVEETEQEKLEKEKRKKAAREKKKAKKIAKLQAKIQGKVNQGGTSAQKQKQGQKNNKQNGAEKFNKKNTKTNNQHSDQMKSNSTNGTAKENSNGNKKRKFEGKDKNKGRPSGPIVINKKRRHLEAAAQAE